MYAEKFEEQNKQIKENIVNKNNNPKANQIVSIYAYQELKENDISELLTFLEDTKNKLNQEMKEKEYTELVKFYIKESFEKNKSLLFQFDTKVKISNTSYNNIIQYYYYIGNYRFTVNIFIEVANEIVKNIYYEILELNKYHNFDSKYNLYDRYYHYVDNM